MTADMSAFFADVIGSYQLGPLLLEARGMYTTGNRAGDNLAKGIRYYQPLWSCPGFVKGELLSRRLTAPTPRGIGR